MAKSLPIIGTVAGTLLGSLIGAPWLGAIVGGLLGGLAANALIKPPKSQQPGDLDQSPTYGWDRIETQYTSGQPIPIVYGEHRVGGNVISQFVANNWVKLRQWGVEKSVGEIAFSGTPLIITTASNDVMGFSFKFSISDRCRDIRAIFMAATHSMITVPPFNVRVEYKLTAETVYKDAGVFPVWGRNNTITVESKRSGRKFSHGCYDIRLTIVNTASNGARVYTVGYGNEPAAMTAILMNVTFNELRMIQSTEDTKSFLSTLVAVSEGEIESIGGVYVNDQPLDNFSDSVSIETRVGTSTQAVVGDFAETKESISQAQELKKDDPVLYTTTDTIDAFELEFAAPNGMYQVVTTTKKKLWSKSVSVNTWGAQALIEIEYKKDGAADYTSLGIITFSSAPTQSSKRFAFRHDLDAKAVYHLRLTRRDADITSSEAANKLAWIRINEVTYDSLNYPNTALLGLKVLATDQLQGSPPNISCVVKGRRIKNYITNVTEWSDNPAWILADLLLNERYGLGGHLTEIDLDIASFITASNWYNELVDDGTGTFVKRFTLDIVLDATERPLDILQTMLAACRSFIVWSGGKIKLRPDKNDPAIQSFTEDNIIEKSFSFSYLAAGNQSNAVEVQYRNREKEWERDSVIVETTALAAGFEVERKKSSNMIGLTRYHQAYRIAKYLMNSSKYQTISCSFKVSLEGIFVEPGDVITVTHSVAGWVQKPFRVLSIETEGEGDLSLNCIEHISALYMDTIPPVIVPKFTTLDNPLDLPSPIENLTLSEFYTTNSPIKTCIRVSFQPPAINYRAGTWSEARAYIVSNEELRNTHGGELKNVLQFVGSSRTGEIDIPDVEVNRGYWLYVTSVSSKGIETSYRQAVRSYIFVTGKSTPPADVSKFWAVQVDKLIYFRWLPVADIASPVKYHIRMGTYWNTAYDIANNVEGSQVVAPFVLVGGHTLMIKAEDSAGNFSTNATYASLTVAQMAKRKIVLSFDEIDKLDTSSEGVMTNMVSRYPIFSPTDKKVLALQPTTTNSEMVFGITDSYYDLPVALEGEYETQVIDFGRKTFFELHIDPGMNTQEDKKRAWSGLVWCGDVPNIPEPGYISPTYHDGCSLPFATGAIKSDYIGRIAINQQLLTAMSTGILPLGLTCHLRTPYPAEGTVSGTPGVTNFTFEFQEIYVDSPSYEPIVFKDIQDGIFLDPIDLAKARSDVKQAIINVQPSGTLTLPHTMSFYLLQRNLTTIPILKKGFPPLKRAGHCPKWNEPNHLWGDFNMTELHIDICGSDDGVTFGPCQNISSGGEYKFQAFTLKFRMKTENPWISPELWKALIQLDLPERIEADRVTLNLSDSPGTTITFDEAFYQIPDVTLTPIGNTFTSAPMVLTVSTSYFVALAFDLGGNRSTEEVIFHACGV